MRPIRYFLPLALLFMLNGSASAQSGFYPSPTFSSSTFPFGGFDLNGFDFRHIRIGPNTSNALSYGASGDSDLILSMLNFGFNTWWFNGSFIGSPHASGGGAGFNGPVTSHSVLASVASLAPANSEAYWGQYGGVLDAFWLGSNNADQTPRAKEKRYFLASAWEPVPTSSNPSARNDRSQSNPVDYDRSSWTKQEPNSGDPDFSVEPTIGGSIVSPSIEWHASKTGSTPPNGGILMQLRQDYNQPLSGFWCNDYFDPNSHAFVYNGVGRDTAYDPQTQTYGGYDHAMVYCDFVYRLSDLNDKPNASETDLRFARTDVLYNITADYYYHGATVPGTTTTVLHVTRGAFEDSIAANHPNENPRILSFGKRNYATLRLPIYIDQADNSTHVWPDKVIIKLVAVNGGADIFIRGFRLRNALMDNLENHLHDHPANSVPNGDYLIPNAFKIPVGQRPPGPYQYLSDAFSTLALSIATPYSDGSLRWDSYRKVHYITCGGEMHDPEGFRALAFVDAYLNKWASRSQAVAGVLTPFQSMHLQNWFDQNYEYYRAIYEDETGKLPLATNEEGGINFDYQFWNNATGNGDNTTHGGDELDDALLPIPADALQRALTTASGYQAFDAPVTGSADVTNHWWNHVGGVSSRTHTPTFDTYELDYLAAYSRWNKVELAHASFSANPPQSQAAERGKWNAFVPTITSFSTTPGLNSVSISPGAALYWQRSDLLSTVITNRLQCALGFWAGNPPSTNSLTTPLPTHASSSSDTYHDIFESRSTQHSGSNPSWGSGDDALSGWKYVYPYKYERGNTATEIRMLAWDALAFGAKGIFFNPVGSDGNENIGITDRYLHHDYDYDLSEPASPTYGSGGSDNSVHPPLISNFLAPPIPLGHCVIGSLDPSTGYTDHLIYSPSNGTDHDKSASRWIPIIDCAGIGCSDCQIVESCSPDPDPTNHRESFNYYISKLPTGTPTFGNREYYNIGTTSVTDWKPVAWNCGWTAFWHDRGDVGIFPGSTPSCNDGASPCNMGINLWPVAYEGFQERARGVSLVANDLKPIARILSSAIFDTSVDYHLLKNYLGTSDQVAKAWADVSHRSPIDLTSLTAFKTEQYDPSVKLAATSGEHIVDWVTGSLDPETSSVVASGSTSSLADNPQNLYCQLGFFDISQSTSLARNVIIVNPRSWPIYRNDGRSACPETTPVLKFDKTSCTRKLLGAVDARIFSMLINPSAFVKHPYMQVYNSATGLEQSFTHSQRFEIELDPGQGALLTFTPQTHVILSPPHACARVIYNNARRLGACESPLFSSFIQVFEDGGIFVAAPRDTIDGIYRRVGGATLDSVIDTARYARTPSIAVNSDSGTTGLVYTIDSVGPYKNQSLVLFRFGHAATPYAYSAADTLAIEPMGGIMPVAPSITPAAHGKFWVAYRDSSDWGKITLVDSNGHTVASQRISNGAMQNTGFLSVAATLHPYASYGGFSYTITTAVDTCYIAFQAGIPGATQIYQLKAYVDPYIPSKIDTTGLFWASKGLIWCESKNPQIHVTRKRSLSLTWDGIAMTASGPEATATRSHHTVLLRRSGMGVWDNYTTFSGFDVKLDAGIVDTMSTWPVVSEADSKSI